MRLLLNPRKIEENKRESRNIGFEADMLIIFKFPYNNFERALCASDSFLRQKSTEVKPCLDGEQFLFCSKSLKRTNTSKWLKLRVANTASVC